MVKPELKKEAGAWRDLRGDGVEGSLEAFVGKTGLGSGVMYVQGKATGRSGGGRHAGSGL